MGLQDLEKLGVGDTIRIVDQVIGLDVENRVVSMEYNPIFSINVSLEIANNIELITDKISQIQTDIKNIDTESAVKQEQLYNGVYISQDEGFVAVRSDEKSENGDERY